MLGFNVCTVPMLEFTVCTVCMLGFNVYTVPTYVRVYCIHCIVC